MPKYTVCTEDEIAVEGLKPFKAGDKKLIIYRLEDGFYATQSQCTHLFASMAKGKVIDGCKIQCPLHRARFDIKTGDVVDWANFPPGVQILNGIRGEKALTTYPVTVESGQVVVELAE